MRALKRPHLFSHLEGVPHMRATLRRQGDVEQILAAALLANSRIDFSHRLELSWPTARRYLWAQRTPVLECAARRLASAKAELLRDAFQLDKIQTVNRENEIRRLEGLWVVRYLNGF